MMLLWTGNVVQVCLLFLPLPYFEFCFVHIFLSCPLFIFTSSPLFKSSFSLFCHYALGGSITASRSLERHIVALESDPDIFNALLRPMRDPHPQRTSRQLDPPTTSIFDPPQKMAKRTFGFLCA